jgi:NAD(P)-dependent dehydrogenase (short-subunit alcohol dehydrogenase family)
VRRFDGRVAIVTGASRGIGAATAERLAAEGAHVFVTARTLDGHDRIAGTLRETVARCERHGARVAAHVADLADEESRATIVPAALERFGRVDVLVNNAAAAIYGPTLDYPLRRRRLTFEVNVHAPLDLAQAVAPGMVERGEGWIVGVSSATSRPVPGPPFRNRDAVEPMTVYGASKAALEREMHGLALALDGTGVRVTTIEPRAAVLSEGAAALVGDRLAPDQIEPMEAMVEAVTALCACDPTRSGQHVVSLDLLAELGREPRGIGGGPLRRIR